jgi:hypothetical protein
MLSRRAGELAGLVAIGDGTMAFLKPEEHAALWRGGPQWWDSTVRYFEERPTLTRTLGIAGVLFGIWLAARQEPESAAADAVS